MLSNKYIKIFLIFIGIAVALTVISRAADSITVAKVNAESVKRGSLVQRTTVNGEVDASKKHYIRSSTALRVEEILVGQGSAVEIGDALFSLDQAYLAEEAGKLSTELANARLEIQKLRLESGGNSSSMISALSELERALADDEFNRSINNGMQLMTDKRKIEDAQRKLEEAEKSANKNSIDVAIRENSMKLKQKEYDDLQEIIKNGGKILSDVKGSVGDIFAAPGEILKGDNYCTIIPDEANFIFVGEINSDDASYMKTGDSISISLSGKSRALNNITIKSVSREENRARVIADLPSGTETYLGQKATLTHEQKSEEYRSLVPLSAVRGSEGDYYILIVGEVKGVLGTQKTAQRAEVAVRDKDNKNAVIEGGFTANDLIISKSNKPVSEGDRVRVQSAEIR